MNKEEGPPIPLCKSQSRKNSWPFQTSRIISKTLSRAREIQSYLSIHDQYYAANGDVMCPLRSSRTSSGLFCDFKGDRSIPNFCLRASCVHYFQIF